MGKEARAFQDDVELHPFILLLLILDRGSISDKRLAGWMDDPGWVG